MTLLCRCLRDAAVYCPRCHEPACSRCARYRAVCARCGETLIAEPERFEAWVDSHLRDQIAERATESVI